MATRYLAPAGGAWIDATSAIWAGASGGAADGGIAAGDTAVLDAASGNLTFSPGSICAALTITAAYANAATYTGSAGGVVCLGVLTVAGGTLATGIAGLDLAGLAVSGGTITGTGTWTPKGTFDVTGGNWAGFSGTLALWGAVQIVAMIPLAGAGLAFGSAYVESAATIDCTGMAATNVACHIMGGTVSNVNNGSAEPIHCHGTIDGGGNAGVDFDKHAARGSMMMTGAGV